MTSVLQNSKREFLFIWKHDSSVGKESTCNAGDLGSTPGLGRSSGEGKGSPLQCSGLENSTDLVHGVTKSWTRLNDFHFTLLVYQTFITADYLIPFFNLEGSHWGLLEIIYLNNLFLWNCQCLKYFSGNVCSNLAVGILKIKKRRASLVVLTEKEKKDIHTKQLNYKVLDNLRGFPSGSGSRIHLSPTGRAWVWAKLRESVMDREAWRAAVRGVQRVRHDWATDLNRGVGDTRDVGSILGWGISPGEGNGNPLQYSCLENPMDRGAQWATVRGVATEQLKIHNGW